MGILNLPGAQERKLYYKNKVVNRLIRPFENKRLFNPLQLSIYTLKDYGLWPDNLIALDAFCQTGLQWTRVFSKECAYLEMWDINPEVVKYAKRGFPDAHVVHGDSIMAMKNKGFSRSDFNFILIDSPVPFQYPDQTFEHFSFFDDMFKNAADNCVIIWDVVPDIRKMLSLHPTSEEFERLWKADRARFYEIPNGENLHPGDMLDFYTKKVTNLGRKVNYISYNARNEFFGFITMAVSNAHTR